MIYDILDLNPAHPVYRLCNLREDPAESTDVAVKHEEKVSELLGLLEGYRQSGRSVPSR